jgi:hypothetical protein
MPCRVDEPYQNPFSGNKDYVKRTVYNALLAEANLATKLLCKLTTELAKTGDGRDLINQTEGLPSWIRKHEAEDRKREAQRLSEVRDKLRKAFPKLSESELTKLINTNVFKEEE